MSDDDGVIIDGNEYNDSLTNRSFHELYAAPSFDEASFVTKWSAPPATLSSLRTELRTVEDRVKSQLIDLLNREYSDFIALSQSLVGTHEQIASLTTLLHDARIPLSSASDALVQQRRAIDTTVAARDDATSRRATFQRLADICDGVKHVQSLLAMCHTPPPIVASVTVDGKSDSKRLTVSSSLDSVSSASSNTGAATATIDDPYTIYEAALNEEADVSLLDMSTPLSLTLPATTTAATATLTSTTASSSSYMSRASVRHNAVILERVARQVTWLHTLITSDAQRWQLIIDQRTSLSVIDTELDRHLSSTLTAALHYGDMHHLRQCLRGYAAADRCHVAERLIRTQIVRPFVVAQITKDKFTLPPVVTATTTTTTTAAAAAGGHGEEKTDADNGLAVIYVNIITFVRTRLSSLLSLSSVTKATPIDTSSSSSSSSSSSWPFHFDFMGNAIWAEIADGLCNTLGSTLFQNGIPDLFHRHYSQSLSLLRSLEQLLCNGHDDEHTTALLQRFRDHESVRSFLARWNPLIYFNLRYQRLATPLLVAINKPLMEQSSIWHISSKSTTSLVSNTSSNDISSLTLEASRVVWQSLQSCCSDSVWLDELGHRFLKLQLQLLSRLATWIEGITATPSTTDTSTPSSLSLSSSGTDDRHVLLLLISIIYDVRCLTASVTTSLVPRMCTRFESLRAPAEAIAPVAVLIRESFHDGCQRLHRTITPVLDRIAMDISRRCISILDTEVPRIKATYRMTGKAPPSHHSEYASMILHYMRTILMDDPSSSSSSTPSTASSVHQSVRQLMSDDDRHHIAMAVISRASLRMATLSNELLEAVRSTESSLARLNKTRSTASSSGSSDMSDSDKMVLQLALDINEYIRQSSACGVTISTCHELDRLAEQRSLYRSQLDARWHRVIDKQ